jgi:hypothetical protein
MGVLLLDRGNQILAVDVDDELRRVLLSPTLWKMPLQNHRLLLNCRHNFLKTKGRVRRQKEASQAQNNILEGGKRLIIVR